MTRPPKDVRYSGVAIAFHWVIALLVVVNLAIGLLHDALPAMRSWMPGHKAIGITILFLTLARVAWRLVHRAPPLPADSQAWERNLERATHMALYALLLIMPLSGWAMVSGTAKRRSLEWFGAFDIPYLPVSTGGGDLGHEAHGLLGWTMLVLVALHIAGALRHHLILRDDVVARMAPVLRR